MAFSGQIVISDTVEVTGFKAGGLTVKVIIFACWNSFDVARLTRSYVGLCTVLYDTWRPETITI